MLDGWIIVHKTLYIKDCEFWLSITEQELSDQEAIALLELYLLK
jgi:uncharacterized membrane protein